MTQALIEDKLEKRRRNLLAGPANKKMAIFIDDVNMPAADDIGTQPPIELLRQFADYGGIYDRDDRFWKHIEDSVLIAAAAPPGGGRKQLSKRFTRHFHMVCLPPTPEESLNHIFKSICEGFLSEGFKSEIKVLSKGLVEGTINVYNSIAGELRPTPAKSHYTFNLRDISKIFQGVLMTKASAINRPEKLIKLWMHEACRVFHDRLVCDEDKRWFTEYIV
jgi:dynein heavy chain